MAVIGVGVDVVDVERFAAVLRRTPALAERVFTPAERAIVAPERLAARFAAKEALAKALGAPAGLAWHDAEVVRAASGRPSLRVTGTVEQAATALGVRAWQVSLSHDGGMAIAVVIADG
jgi:holo-[acyl-carrier protein] synthase